MGVGDSGEPGTAAPAGATAGPGAAAFFDLDKTVLAKSSSLAFARKFYETGLINRADALRAACAQFVYMVSGADHDQMEQMRLHVSQLIVGWPVDDVHRVVSEGLHEIVHPLIYEEAQGLLAEHRSAGRETVIISSSGVEVVEPIGKMLGADLTIATRMATAHGRYTGEIAFYSYGSTKADAMRELAAERGYSLSDCYAYTDSHTDLPMLEAVGHPVATNPDTRLRRTARERGWPVLDFAKPEALRSSSIPPPARAAAVALGGAVALGIAKFSTRSSNRG